MLLVLMMEGMLLIIVIYLLFYFISYKMINSLESISPYECGFDPKSMTRLMFSYRFFLIAILFLVFDVEISLMLSIPYMLVSVQGMWVFLFFVMILVLGLLYEYYFGSLNWLN